MSRFLSDATRTITPYTPGEQPKDKTYIKLNTNECPYPQSPMVEQAINAVSKQDLRLYPHPDSIELKQAIAENLDLEPENIFVAGGSDEALAFAFMAFCSRGKQVYFPDITYGFYKVYADLFGLCAVEVPLKEDFTVDIADYFCATQPVFIAQPNAPTGIALVQSEIIRLLEQNPNRLLVVDEAYIDFATVKSCAPLVKEYDNLLVIQTFSKSRSLAGMRLGMVMGNPELIAGLQRVQYSFNPYNIDRISLAVGVASINDKEYFEDVCCKIIATRERIYAKLIEMGFTVMDSSANFLFAKHDKISGVQLYNLLRDSGILVRHFSFDRIKDYIRITIGTDSEMDVFIEKVFKIIM